MCIEQLPIVLIVHPDAAPPADLVRDIADAGSKAIVVHTLEQALNAVRNNEVMAVVFDARRGALATSALAVGVGAMYPWVQRVWLHGEGPLPVVADVVRQLMGDPVSTREWPTRLRTWMGAPVLAAV